MIEKPSVLSSNSLTLSQKALITSNESSMQRRAGNKSQGQILNYTTSTEPSNQQKHLLSNHANSQKSVLLSSKAIPRYPINKSREELDHIFKEVIIKNVKIDKNYLDLSVPQVQKDQLNSSFNNNSFSYLIQNKIFATSSGYNNNYSFSATKPKHVGVNSSFCSSVPSMMRYKQDTSLEEVEDQRGIVGEFDVYSSSRFTKGKEFLPLKHGHSLKNSISSMPQIHVQKEMEYLCNSQKYLSKIKERENLPGNPFLPSINEEQFVVAKHKNSLKRRRSSYKDDQSDMLIPSQQQIDLFSLVVPTQQHIKIPSGNAGASYKLKSYRNLSQPIISNFSHQENQQETAKIEQEKTLQETDQQKNSANKEASKASMLDNYSSPSIRENIVSTIKETLIGFIKGNKELNEVSYQFQTKKEGYEVKVIGYQQKKEQLASSKGLDRYASFAEYLSRFSGYVLDLVFCDIPITSGSNNKLKFEIPLTQSVMEIILPIISQKVKEFGMNDLIMRYENVFQAEFLNTMVNAPIVEEFKVAENLNPIVENLLNKIQEHYQSNFSLYSSTCLYFLTDLVQEGSKQKINDYMKFILMHLKRSNDSESLPSLPGLQDAGSRVSQIQEQIQFQLQQSLMKRNSLLITSRNEQIQQSKQKGIVINNLRVNKEDLFFIKKTLYDVIRKQIPSLSLTNRAKILEKVELFRFSHFKEIYYIDEYITQRLIQTMKTQIENSPLLLNYFRRPESGKQIQKFLTNLLDSILGESNLQSFIEKSSSILSIDLDWSLISMLEQGIKGQLAQSQINPCLLKEIEYKFIHLRRRTRLTPPFNAAFYQIDQIIKFMRNWINLMEQHKQFKSDNKNIDIIQQIKQLDFLEYFLVCSLSDYDTFSLDDLACGLNYYGISKASFQFWMKGIKRIFAKLKLKQKEINLIEDYFQKAYDLAQ